ADGHGDAAVDRGPNPGRDADAAQSAGREGRWRRRQLGLRGRDRQRGGRCAGAARRADHGVAAVARPACRAHPRRQGVRLMAPRYVSRSVKRTEDPPLLMGRAHFTGALRLPGLRSVVFLRSPHAHARIVHIDTRAARAVPGVEAILTAADLSSTTRPIRAAMSGAGYQEIAWPPLAVDKVRF